MAKRDSRDAIVIVGWGEVVMVVIILVVVLWGRNALNRAKILACSHVGSRFLLTIRNALFAIITGFWRGGGGRRGIHRLESRAMKESNCTAPNFSTHLRVYYEDTDSGGVVYYANYLKFFERCRTEWVRSLGYDQSALADTHDLVFVVRCANATYYKPARLDDVLRVDLQIQEITRSRIKLAQRVVKVNSALPLGGESVLVGGNVEIVCVRASTFKPVAIPAFLYATFQEIV